jgi:protein kinase C substrate 80K-H
LTHDFCYKQFIFLCLIQTEEEDEEEEESPPPFFPPRDAELMETTTQSQESTTTEYDEETKQLIENAKKARDEYNEIEGKFLDIQNKIRELEVNLEIDYGPNDEFLPLHGQCFELTDREYIYKLCPFDNASQRSKNGGSETSLGFV